MNKILLLTLLYLFPFFTTAQPVLPVYDKEEYGFDIKPQNLYLEAEKNLCELKEIVNVNIRMLIAGKEDGVPNVFNYKFKDPADAPWTIGEYKIVSGGAKIGNTEGSTAQVILPAVMPAGKAVIVQVTLNPLIKTDQQVQLFTTIYLEDNDNVFYFNCPFLHINHEKYVIKNNGGALANGDKAVKKAGTAGNASTNKLVQDYAMKAATADITATIHGFNMDALTSNAKAIYAKEEDVTTVIINDQNIEMINGLKTDSKRMYMIALSFPGKSTGNFKIRADKKITAAVTLPQVPPGYACACQEDPSDPDHKPPTCMGGTIRITKYDEKTKMLEGTVMAYLESADPVTGNVFYSTLNGKFRVPLAN